MPDDCRSAGIKSVICRCGNEYAVARYALGYRVCLACGELAAKQVKHCIVPLHKSNYIVVTDKALLVGINSKVRK